MAKYGITPEQTYGVKIPHLRAIAKEYRKNRDKIAALESKSARWIAADALRELKSDAIRKRLNI